MTDSRRTPSEEDEKRLDELALKELEFLREIYRKVHLGEMSEEEGDIRAENNVYGKEYFEIWEKYDVYDEEEE